MFEFCGLSALFRLFFFSFLFLVVFRFCFLSSFLFFFSFVVVVVVVVVLFTGTEKSRAFNTEEVIKYNVSAATDLLVRLRE